MAVKFKPFDSADHLKSDEDIVAYLDAVLGEGDPALIAYAIGVVARARGMTNISRETNLGRESLYKALSLEGNPEFATVMKVLHSLGIRLRVEALAADA